MTKPKVLITGANGLIGGLVLRDLGDRYDFSGLSRHPVEGIPYTTASVTDLDGVRARSPAWTWSSISPARPRTPTTGTTTSRSRPAARSTCSGPPPTPASSRVVFMSTGSTMCGWEWDDRLPYGRLARGDRDLPDWDLLDYRTPPRPDSPYGVAKLFGEAAARWFSDQTPLSVLVIRLGAVLASNRPELIRHFPGFLAQEDAVQMIDRCLSAPPTSGSASSMRSPRTASAGGTPRPAKEVLGWRPTGSSDRFDPSELDR